MKSNLTQYLNNKRIALLGNAKSILNKEKDFNNYQVIIRMNNGHPEGKEKFIGSRTDILVLSTLLSEETIKEFNAKYVFWATPKNRDNTKYDFYYDLVEWGNLFKKLRNNRPSTGCMIFDYLVNNVNFELLDLYGFDFWSTPTWYTNSIYTAQHSPEKEKDYVMKQIEKNMRIKLRNE